MKLKGYKLILSMDGHGFSSYSNDNDYNYEPIKYDGSDNQSIVLYSKEQLEEAGILIDKFSDLTSEESEKWIIKKEWV